MMSIYRITAVDIRQPERAKVERFHIDAPVVGTSADHFALGIRGWALAPAGQRLKSLQVLVNEKLKMVADEGEGQFGDKPNFGDWQKGSGRGFGKRDKGEGDTGGFKSQVKGKLQKGETVVTGSADGGIEITVSDGLVAVEVRLSMGILYVVTSRCLYALAADAERPTQPGDFESPASTNFTTPALWGSVRL